MKWDGADHEYPTINNFYKIDKVDDNKVNGSIT